MPIENVPAPAQFAEKPKRPLWQSIWRGAARRCPHCGQGRMFSRYLKVSDHCQICGEALHHHRADDAPPYFTVFAVGHMIVPIMLATETAFAPPLWMHLALFLPLTVLLCLLLLPVFKGATVGLQWANYMHGFDPNDPDTALRQ